MTGQELARDLIQEPDWDVRHASAANAQNIAPKRIPRRHHETADTYAKVFARLCIGWRVIVCKDDFQWILQRLDGERSGQPRWRGVKYFRTREALIKACRAVCERIDPAALAALAALPETYGGMT